MPPKTWMVRAGKRGALIDRFRNAGRVAIGWSDLGSLAVVADRPAMVALVRAQWPDWNAYEVGNNAGQLHRFRSEIQAGDRVISYDPEGRVYHVGSVGGGYAFEPVFDPDYPNVRPVAWIGTVPRDALSVAAKNSLGSVTTVFQVPADTAAELDALLPAPGDRAPVELAATIQGSGNVRGDLVVGPAPSTTLVDSAAEAAAEQELFEDLEAKALEFIKDRLAKLSARDMELFVAGLLRAMGYKTRVSAIGPDRGIDIFASPDGLGLQEPRIFVEVKHRSGAIGAPLVRSFLGGRRLGDRGLYVSTGGFTREARYEAERSTIPLSLLDLDDLVALALEHYDALDVDAKPLLALKRLYWPA
ncbi:restriction endonuclease [Azospirillum agricola]|uniref:restriction endonuclease n=1 Tax=Azospirillum agricola TaxID=1720247 RepID=UPI000A0EFA7D|nr:restriction endonuclease [Azospirillum agricola]SMH58570.1 restriction system protein [Azospirillum lipoferum]